MTEEKEFDFTGAKEAGADEIATGGNPEEETRDAEVAAFKAKPTAEELEEQLAEEKIDVEINEEQRRLKGFPTAEVIAEARKLAESKVGLDLDTFFAKHGLINVNIEQLLHAPLHEVGPKKGTFK